MTWLDRFRSHQSRRRRALRGLAPGPMHDFLAAEPPDPDMPVSQLPLVSLDLETTGLDPARDQIVSIGLVELRHGRIALDSAWHQLLRIEGALPPESVAIHQITDDHLDRGRPLGEILPRLLQRLRGRVMLVHYRAVEQDFLDAACRRLFGAPFIIPTVDTLRLGQRILMRRNPTIGVNELRLFNLRSRFNLPRYQAHNALMDALATAELFLALMGEISPRNTARLRDILAR